MNKLPRTREPNIEDGLRPIDRVNNFWRDYRRMQREGVTGSVMVAMHMIAERPDLQAEYVTG
jgi:hypothetical protein